MCRLKLPFLCVKICNCRRDFNFFSRVISQFTATCRLDFVSLVKMEPTQASNFQLPLGSPIIHFDADLPIRNSAVDTNAVGSNIAHHFDEFRRQKRSLIAPPVLNREPGNVSSVSGFRDTHHCCRLCLTLLPATSFYPSNLKRSTFYCKTCCVAKASTHKGTHKAKDRAAALVAGENVQATDAAAFVSIASPLTAVDRRHGSASQADPALKMLNRLRRMCARPSECGFRFVLSNPISLNFDVKVARQLLLWWNSTSALGPTTEGDHEVRFIPWHKEDPSLPLQPWEVIPVTRMQARRLTSTPTHLWMELLQPSAVTHVTTRSAELKRLILGRDHEASP